MASVLSVSCPRAVCRDIAQAALPARVLCRPGRRPLFLCVIGVRLIFVRGSIACLPVPDAAPPVCLYHEVSPLSNTMHEALPATAARCRAR